MGCLELSLNLKNHRKLKIMSWIEDLKQGLIGKIENTSETTIEGFSNELSRAVGLLTSQEIWATYSTSAVSGERPNCISISLCTFTGIWEFHPVVEIVDQSDGIYSLRGFGIIPENFGIWEGFDAFKIALIEVIRHPRFLLLLDDLRARNNYARTRNAANLSKEDAKKISDESLNRPYLFSIFQKSTGEYVEFGLINLRGMLEIGGITVKDGNVRVELDNTVIPGHQILKGTIHFHDPKNPPTFIEVVISINPYAMESYSLIVSGDSTGVNLVAIDQNK
jgi:hypothetical protein